MKGGGTEKRERANVREGEGKIYRDGEHESIREGEGERDRETEINVCNSFCGYLVLVILLLFFM